VIRSPLPNISRASALFKFVTIALKLSRPPTSQADSCIRKLTGGYLTKTCLVALVTCAPPLAAQLPTLNEQPWLGYFAASEQKDYSVGITSAGEIVLIPMNEKGESISESLKAKIQVGVLETLPDGKETLRQVIAESLSSSEGVTDRLGKTTIRGKVNGDAAIEIELAVERGALTIGGRVTDPGKLTKTAICLGARIRFPNFYAGVKRDEKSAEKLFQNRIKKDRLDLKWTDGKRVKLPFDKVVDASSKELNGPGIASAQLEVSAYKDKQFVITASEDSVMKLSNPKSAPLHEGFSITWGANPDKATGRVSIVLK
jgi:hypothetical protein